MKVSVVGGLVIAAPIILHQIWLFVKPALTVREKHYLTGVLPVAIGLFGIGIVFSYFLVLPAAVKFFMGFATDGITTDVFYWSVYGLCIILCTALWIYL